MTLQSLYKTFDNGISFEKPHIDPATLKPVFHERISFSSKHKLSLDDAKKFLLDLREVTNEVDMLKHLFLAYENNDEKLRELAAEYQ